MNPQERTFIIQELRSGRERLVGAVAGLTALQWQFRPSGAEWSPADCVEHLAVMEDRIYKLLLRSLESPASPAERALTEGKDDMLIRAVPDRRRKVKAPEFVEPKGRWEPEEALRRFAEDRERTIQFAETTAKDLRNHVSPHPILRELDGYQWLLILSAHGERHTRQIEEVKQCPGFPGADSSKAAGTGALN